MGMEIGPKGNFNTAQVSQAATEEVKTNTNPKTLGAEDKGAKYIQLLGNDRSTETSDKPGASSKLPNPNETHKRAGSVSMSDTIAVMFQAAQQQRELGSQDRASALEANEKNLLASADKMKEAAAAKKSAALSSAIAGIVGSSISMIGNGVALGMSLKKVEIKTEVDDSFDLFAKGFKIEKVDKYSELTTGAVGKVASSMGDLSSSAGKVAAAGQEFEADIMSANSKKDEAMAARQEKRYQEANEFRENAKQAQNAVMDYLRALAQSQVETEKAIARNL